MVTQKFSRTNSVNPSLHQSPTHSHKGDSEDIEMIDTIRRNYQPKDSDNEDECTMQYAKYLSMQGSKELEVQASENLCKKTGVLPRHL
jgi:hypothetical protein